MSPFSALKSAFKSAYKFLVHTLESVLPPETPAESPVAVSADNGSKVAVTEEATAGATFYESLTVGHASYTEPDAGTTSEPEAPNNNPASASFFENLSAAAKPPVVLTANDGALVEVPAAIADGKSLHELFSLYEGELGIDVNRARFVAEGQILVPSSVVAPGTIVRASVTSEAKG
jgi:hypothetical protein